MGEKGRSCGFNRAQHRSGGLDKRQVPELTRSADIQLNSGLWLRCYEDLSPFRSPDNCAPRPGPHQRSRQAIILRLAALLAPGADE